MTVSTAPVFNWSRSGLDWNAYPYEQPSPNLVALLADLVDRFGGGNMGIHWDREIRGGGKISEHAYGAALDWGWNTAQIEFFEEHGIAHGPRLTPAQADSAIDWIVTHSAELGVQAIVAIGRSWKSDRTNNGAGGWIPYDSGYTGHCHIVTTFDAWSNATPIAERLAITPPDPEEDDMLQPPFIQRPPQSGKYADNWWIYCQGGSNRCAALADFEGESVPVKEDATDEGDGRWEGLYLSTFGVLPTAS